MIAARLLASLVLLLGLAAPAAAAPDPTDPLASPSWKDLRRQYLGDAPVVFDPRVEVLAPQVAEDSMNVPVPVSSRDLPDVKRILVIADLNPIIKVLEFEPLRASPRLSFRLKLQQASPVRALAQTGDGVWHVGGVWVDAAGGGCTAPSVGRATGNWADTLNQVDVRAWESAGMSRIKLRIMHPMDTGLAPGIPAFYLQQLSFRDERGDEWLRLATYEPVSENPMFSIEFAGATPPLRLEGRDNNGNRVDVKVKP